MSETFKHMGFMLLVILVTISAVYTWAETEPTLRDSLGVGGTEDFGAGALQQDIDLLKFQTTHIITGNVLTDLLNLIPNLANFFYILWKIFTKIMFGWTGLLSAIFASIGMPMLSWIFIPPIAIIQIIAGFYFFRDIVNTIRGVG